jgi:hypothetical protein
VRLTGEACERRPSSLAETGREAETAFARGMELPLRSSSPPQARTTAHFTRRTNLQYRLESYAAASPSREGTLSIALAWPRIAPTKTAGQSHQMSPSRVASNSVI